MTKKLLLFLFLFEYANSQVLFIEEDKQKHFTYSASIAAVSNCALNHFTFVPRYLRDNALPVSFLTSFSVGVLKEISDSYEANNKFDSNDLVADAIGSFVGSTFAESFNGYFIKIGLKKNPNNNNPDGAESTIGFAF